MKKLFVTMIALAVAATAFAQFPKGLSIDAGYAANKKVVGGGGLDLDFGFSNYEFGASYNLALGESGLGVAPGIRFGFGSGDYSIAAANGKMTWKESYLAVPVLVNYAFPVGDVLKVVPFLGPTLHYGLSAKMKAGEEEADMYSDDEEGEIDYKHLNLFVGGGVALDIAEIVRVSIGYDLGLLDRAGSDEGKIQDKGGIRVGVSYLF